jgi:hypothetical protein
MNTQEIKNAIQKEWQIEPTEYNLVVSNNSWLHFIPVNQSRFDEECGKHFKCVIGEWVNKKFSLKK